LVCGDADFREAAYETLLKAGCSTGGLTDEIVFKIFLNKP